jgi:uncharacterized repeat protein (TIGR01451 family)
VNGTSATSFNGDGGGGGGGGGGFTAGTAGTSNADAIAATGGGGGGNCTRASPLILYSAISAVGGAGAAGRTAPIGTVGPRGTAGSVIISTSGLSVQKTSSVFADTISGANPKAVPGSTVIYCILVTNIWASTATTVTINDPLPAQTVYVANTLASGTSCANATTVPPAGASVTGTTVNASVASLAAGASYALAFRVIVN